ncbi:MAG: hypothetical protein AB2556_26740 [Candidatus Thiodiazotropha sp.]
MATDSIYVKKTVLCKLEGIGTYKPHEVHPKGYCRICLTRHGGNPEATTRWDCPSSVA